MPKDKKPTVEITDAMIGAGYSALLSEMPAETFHLSPKVVGETVSAVYEAMYRARLLSSDPALCGYTGDLPRGLVRAIAGASTGARRGQ